MEILNTSLLITLARVSMIGVFVLSILNQLLTPSQPMATQQEKTDAHEKTPTNVTPPVSSWDVTNLQVKKVGTPINSMGHKRKFISYTSSKLEQLWLEHADEWQQKREFCKALTELHPELIHQLLNVTCTSHFAPPYEHWCIIDDGIQPLWYNRQNDGTFGPGILRWERPVDVPNTVQLYPAGPVAPGPEMEDVVSKFVYLDETTAEEYVEYIEPLASHLRFPLCRCIATIGPNREEVPQSPAGYAYHAVVFKGWIIPPPPPVRYDKAWYFDAGASSWDQGLGGPSLVYFYTVWQRHGIVFDEIRAFEMTVPEVTFYRSVPLYLRHKTVYQQTAVVSTAQDHNASNPFLPSLIKEKVTENDYVLFKLDIDSPMIEAGSIQYILDDPDPKIDEICWEHHVEGNYLLLGDWRGHGLPNATLRESMDLFLRLRQKGIRAHSWV
jgi:hypothetical protein